MATEEQKQSRKPGNYAVGYRKPPVHTRFGEPGVRNKGRPRGAKSLTSLLVRALRKKARDGKGGEKEFYEVLVESIVVHAAKGNAALVKLIFDYHEGPPPQKHEVTGTIGLSEDRLVDVVGQIIRELLPRDRWEEAVDRVADLIEAESEKNDAAR